ncbi:MAG: single-stranded DNA-binding protein [Chitinophagales bacterium]|nr:single-stranded DNA-binding protein [Chitinophagales bacterium]MCZ2393177.1 single-stranded DNA-binding protein [Chitinophagales bacterium]
MNTVKNFVQLVGNLGRNPEMKTFENGNSIAKFSLATSESYTNKLGEKVQDTQWHNIVAWGKLAKIAEEQLEKGKEVSVKGKITYKNYEDKNGVKKIFTEIVAEEIECIDRPIQTIS